MYAPRVKLAVLPAMLPTKPERNHLFLPPSGMKRLTKRLIRLKRQLGVERAMVFNVKTRFSIRANRLAQRSFVNTATPFYSHS
jgi:hypothetical protein